MRNTYTTYLFEELGKKTNGLYDTAKLLCQGDCSLTIQATEIHEAGYSCSPRSVRSSKAVNQNLEAKSLLFVILHKY